MARDPEDRAKQLVEAALGVVFSGRRTLDKWGQTDDCAVLADGRWIVLEVETTQKHPCTNVLKLWPYLEDHPDQSIVLVHVFTAGAKNETSSRGNLGTWVAEKMTKALGARFTYFRFLIEQDGALSGDVAGARAAVSSA